MMNGFENGGESSTTVSVRVPSGSEGTHVRLKVEIPSIRQKLALSFMKLYPLNNIKSILAAKIFPGFD
jgi:hypothetical protein